MLEVYVVNLNFTEFQPSTSKESEQKEEMTPENHDPNEVKVICQKAENFWILRKLNAKTIRWPFRY